MLKALSNLANLGPILKQAQQMGAKLQGVGETLKKKKITGSAGGGLVEIEANGLGEVIAVRIDPVLMERGDREMMESLLPAAFNQVHGKAKEMYAEAMKSVTQELEVPGLSQALAHLAEGGEGTKNG